MAARSQESADAFARKFDIPHAYDSYGKLAADDDVEVVYVGAINPVHLTVVKQMVEAGKHVLCEKPLGMNVRETREMLDAAKAKGVFLMEAMWSRFLPAHQKLRDLLREGAIGDPLQLNATFSMVIDAPRVKRMDLGGGTTLDLGVYTIALSQLVFGGEKLLKVVATGHLNDEGTDDTVGAVLTYSGGRIATYVTNSRVKSACEAVVYGTKGSLKLLFPFWASDTLIANGKEFSWPYKKGKHEFNFLGSAGLAHEAEHVRQCLIKGLKESPEMSHDDTLKIAEIMEDVRKQVGVHYPQDDK